ncbi:hypothetical protein [Candidatus Korobacter versatilis]|uniref:hypothetical protein n=1 Tax=Candidatus Korobacter versatilis TaxID=658062 RepID=UPI0002ECD9AD|nr:hypothetical protein [Candidatus Koribacter versatilis]
MFPLENSRTLPNERGLKETYWHCGKCEVIIAVHSVRAVNRAYCPICREMELEFCGTIGEIPGQGFASA